MKKEKVELLKKDLETTYGYMFFAGFVIGSACMVCVTIFLLSVLL